MNDYYGDSMCEVHFRTLGTCWHLWTSENFPVIFASREEFMAAMTIIAVVARLCPNVRILTFEIMSNHIHMVVIGQKADIEQMFSLFKKLLESYYRGGRYSKSRNQVIRVVDLSKFCCNMRKLESLSDVRNVIVYDNRNGYLVSKEETPFSYPWGANSYYYNDAAKHVAAISAKQQRALERYEIIHSHISDHIVPLKKVYGYACPLDFCAIEDGEKLFRNASQYFFMVSRPIESHKSIAKELSESIFYTDDELFSTVSFIASNKYKKRVLDLDKDEKLDVAKVMHFEYNSSNKQISRILKLPITLVDTLFPKI